MVTWQGAVSAPDPVTIQFDVTVDDQITSPEVIINTALIDDGQGNVITREAGVVVNGQTLYMPFCAR